MCTDSGREGEYIYRLVAQEAGVKNKKEKRVWIDSQTEEEILRGIRAVSYTHLDVYKRQVLLGQTAQQIADTVKKYGFDNIIFTQSLEEAVEECRKAANPGDAVLLSPACASWGMFDNYEQRGDMFKELVYDMKK